jgi:hypothetical protein
LIESDLNVSLDRFEFGEAESEDFEVSKTTTKSIWPTRQSERRRARRAARQCSAG